MEVCSGTVVPAEARALLLTEALNISIQDRLAGVNPVSDTAAVRRLGLGKSGLTLQRTMPHSGWA